MELNLLREGLFEYSKQALKRWSGGSARESKMLKLVGEKNSPNSGRRITETPSHHKRLSTVGQNQGTSFGAYPVR